MNEWTSQINRRCAHKCPSFKVFLFEWAAEKRVGIRFARICTSFEFEWAARICASFWKHVEFRAFDAFESAGSARICASFEFERVARIWTSCSILYLIWMFLERVARFFASFQSCSIMFNIFVDCVKCRGRVRGRCRLQCASTGLWSSEMTSTTSSPVGALPSAIPGTVNSKST